jgi:sugar phosphate isomerase/epimerase
MPILSVSTFSLYPGLALSEAVRYALDSGWPGIEIWTTPQTTTPSHWDDHRIDRAALRRLAARSARNDSESGPVSRLRTASGLP